MVVKILYYTDKNGVYHDEYLADLEKEIWPGEQEQEQEQETEDINYFED